MASRALIARLSSALSTCPRSANAGQRPAPWFISISISSPRVRRSRSSISVVSRRRSRDSGMSVCRREKASSWRTRPEPRSAARSALSMAGRTAESARSCAQSRLPTMTVSRLLKSWAMPPVSWADGLHLLCLLQLRLRLPLCRDVAPGRKHVQFLVLHEGHGVELPDAFPSVQAEKAHLCDWNRPALGRRRLGAGQRTRPVVWMQQREDRPPDQGVRRIRPEQLRCGRVGKDDRAIHMYPDGLLDEVYHPAVALLCGGQRLRTLTDAIFQTRIQSLQG